jgi:CHAT domain-containing protein/tetratricopeptide (TPR) repeat protein
MKRFAAALTLVLSALCPLSHAQQDGLSVATLSAQVDSLRLAGAYDRALAVAEELLAQHESTADTRRYELEDAERLVSMLRTIAALPEDAQREMMVADSAAVALGPLLDEGAFDEAIALLRDQVDTRRRHLGDNGAAVATSLNNLGYVLDLAGEYGEAEEMYRAAIEIDREVLGNRHPGLAAELDNLAAFLADGGLHEEARALNREALAIFERVGEPSENYAAAMSTLASLYVDEGDYAAAEPLSRRALAMTRRVAGDDSYGVAIQLNELGYILSRKRDYAGAEQYLREAIATYETIEDADPYDYADALNNLAAVYHDQDRLADADPLYRAAIDIFREYEDQQAVARLLNNYADLVHDQGKYDQSEPMYRESLALHRELLGDDHPDVATVLTMLARDLRDQGRYTEAEPIYQEALAVYRGSLGDQHPHIAMCLYSYARSLEAEGQFEAALPLLEEAADVFEVARERAGVGLARATFQKAPYPLLANALLELGNAEGVWAAVEKQRGRVLAELLLTAQVRPLSQGEEQQQGKLLSALGDLERELAAYRQAAADDPSEESEARVAECRSALLEAEAQWAALQNALAEKYPLSEGRSFSIARVQESMPDGAAIIGWLDVEIHKGELSSWVYALPKRGEIEWARVTEDADEASFRRTASSRGSSEIGLMRDAKAIWKKRFGPVQGVLSRVEKLIVIPSGAMLGIPVDAVVDGEGRYLADRYDVSVAPSATLYAWLSERSDEGRLGRGSDALLVGDPPFTRAHLAEMERESGEEVARLTASEMPDAATLRDNKRSALSGNPDALARLPRLRGARIEVDHIHRVFEHATTLAGASASEQELYQLAADDALVRYDLIHLATHALVDDERPEQSALVLSQVDLPDPLEAAVAGRRIHDGLVTASEVVREWHLDADLVTLSACETALGQRVSGEGYIGLANAFLQAGARSVVVSLWKVDDAASSLLMQRFYENLAGVREGERPIPKSAALREAKVWLRTYRRDGETPFSHPYFWSAFVLIGDRG